MSVRRTTFNDAAGVHDIDAVGVARDHAEVVGDDDHRHAEFSREILHQLEDLRLDRHVERRRRLVGDDQLWGGTGSGPWRSSRAGACRR